MLERLVSVDTASALLAGLLNGVLQSFAVVCLTILAMRLLAASAPGIRHLAWLTALVTIAGLSVAQTVDSLVSSAPAAAIPDAAAASPTLAVLNGAFDDGTGAPTGLSGPPFLVELPSSPWFPAVLAALLLIAAARLLLVVRGIHHWRSVRARSEPLPDHLSAILTSVAARAGWRVPTARLSREVVCPVTMGYRRPTILLPPSLLTDLSPLELRQILAHEVAHVTRLDDWTNLGQRIIESVLFFNPLVAWIGRRMEMERELACDRQVLALVGERKAYASCLLRLAATGRFPASGLVTGAAASRLSERVETLLHLPDRKPRPLSFPVLVAAGPVFLFLMAAGPGQMPLRVAIAGPEGAMAAFAGQAWETDVGVPTNFSSENSFVVRVGGSGAGDGVTRPEVTAGDAASSAFGGSEPASDQVAWEVARVDYTPVVTPHSCGATGALGCGDPSQAIPDPMIRTLTPTIPAARAPVTSPTASRRRRGVDVVARGTGRAPTIGTEGDTYEEPRKNGSTTIEGWTSGLAPGGDVIIDDVSPMPGPGPSSLRLR